MQVHGLRGTRWLGLVAEHKRAITCLVQRVVLRLRMRTRQNYAKNVGAMFENEFASILVLAQILSV